MKSNFSAVGGGRGGGRSSALTSYSPLKGVVADRPVHVCQVFCFGMRFVCHWIVRDLVFILIVTSEAAMPYNPKPRALQN